MKRTFIVGLLLAVGALPAWSAEEPHPELPPTAIVARLLAESPTVRAADGQLRVEEANSRRLAAGPHEWTLRLTSQRRDVRPVGSAQRYSEWDTSLERPLRLPGKGSLDEELGQAGIEAGRVGQGDARHETARSLLAAWFDWLRQKSAAMQWQRQTGLLEQQNKAVGRRHQLGDAARIEAVQAEAAQAQAQAQLHQARSRELAARESLLRHFPGLPLPAALPATEPATLNGADAEWLADILRHDHELGLARAETRRAQLHARRSDRDRLPDPTVGLRVASERGGEEKLAGFTLSIPLPGSSRAAVADMGAAQADAAAAREAATLRKVEAEAAALLAQVRGSFESWLASRDAAERLGKAADMAAKAYTLGEGSLSESLNARRLATESLLASDQARLEALEKRNRLLLDAHRLWDFDEDGDKDSASR